MANRRIRSHRSDQIPYEEMGLKQKDLVPIIGSKSKVSEVLNRKIGLSLTMISNLSAQLHIPLEVLVPKVSA
ncbi:hypothetical protein [Sulfuricurvum sp.]|uniref:helix-turn-helix domain-containing protein n=1 Tax=Sulfuricurvum sp. TaxID=2025608 RepID=UPI00260883B6|nr:hypothetical protein [Sulfuricurvum sp.]MDD3598467.1 hypothetical protein [Sulfuricurvum sp.]